MYGLVCVPFSGSAYNVDLKLVTNYHFCNTSLLKYYFNL